MKRLLFVLLMISGISVLAQESQYGNTTKSISNDEIRSKLDIGVGVGLYYGGFMGPVIQYAPLNHLGIFGSAGYFFAGLGWQVGVTGYIMPKIPKKPFRVFGTAMYGTNASIYVNGANYYNKTYLGPSFGAGIEMRFGKSKRNGINVQILIPIRDTQYDDDLNIVKNDPSISIESEPADFNISIGYHFEIR